jgi:hypothetical protein
MENCLKLFENKINKNVSFAEPALAQQNPKYPKHSHRARRDQQQ